jgi:14-3-3 protein epsilon
MANIDLEPFRRLFQSTETTDSSNSPQTRRSQYFFLAQLAEDSYRFDDMCKFMAQVANEAKNGPDLSQDERHLLSSAFKSAVSTRRSAWRTVSADDICIGSNITKTTESDTNTDEVDPTSSTNSPSPIPLDVNDLTTSTVLKVLVESELSNLCLQIISILETNLIPHPHATSESVLFYKKMVGDYYRYLAEFIMIEEQYDEYASKSAQYYSEAMTLATTILVPADPIRLGLALNYSVCLMETVKQRDEACLLAKTALDDAVTYLRTQTQREQPMYKDSKQILSLLKENLSIWTQ